MRVVADTNTIVSALLWDGSPYRLIAAIDEYAIAFYTKPYEGNLWLNVSAQHRRRQRVDECV